MNRGSGVGFFTMHDGQRRGDGAGPSEVEGQPAVAPACEFVKAHQVISAEGLATRDNALLHLARVAVDLGLATDADELYRAFIAREVEGDTGMVDGFAVPHAKSPSVCEASVLILKDPVGIEGWGTMDDLPVTVAIALLIPEVNAGTSHLMVLSKVAEALMDDAFRAAMKAEDEPELVAALVNDRLA